VLQNACSVGTQRLAGESLSLNAEAVADRPAEIAAEAPDVCLGLRSARNRGTDLADHTRNADLEWPFRFRPLAGQRPQRECGPAFHVGPTIVFADSEGVVDGCGEGFAHAGNQSDLRILPRVEKAFDAKLPRETSSGIARTGEIAE